MPFLMIGAFKNGPLSAGADFRSEKKKTAVIRKEQDGFYYFETKKNSLKEVDDFNRNAWTPFSRDYISTTVERD